MLALRNQRILDARALTMLFQALVAHVFCFKWTMSPSMAFNIAVCVLGGHVVRD